MDHDLDVYSQFIKVLIRFSSKINRNRVWSKYDLILKFYNIMLLYPIVSYQ
jgi:hypothetical protein